MVLNKEFDGIRKRDAICCISFPVETRYKENDKWNEYHDLIEHIFLVNFYSTITLIFGVLKQTFVHT
jgi:hypothetical protein